MQLFSTWKVKSREWDEPTGMKNIGNTPGGHSHCEPCPLITSDAIPEAHLALRQVTPFGEYVIHARLHGAVVATTFLTAGCRRGRPERFGGGSGPVVGWVRRYIPIFEFGRGFITAVAVSRRSQCWSREIRYISSRLLWFWGRDAPGWRGRRLGAGSDRRRGCGSSGSAVGGGGGYTSSTAAAPPGLKHADNRR